MARITPAGSAMHHFAGEIGLTMRYGRFAGMRFPRRASGHASFLGAKLLGAYESELHDALEPWMLGQHRQIVDVGAAEGYYAVGLAHGQASCADDAFETDAGSRRLCGEMAELNGALGRISIDGYGDTQVLPQPYRPMPSCSAICEGYEV